MHDYRLSDLLDMSLIQRLADSNFRASGIPMSVIDAIDTSVLVRAGWTDICTHFHRANPLSRQRCMESDASMYAKLASGEAYRYRCKNGMWHFAIPIIVSSRHLGTMFLTQFLFEGEVPEREYFIGQAQEFGYDLDAYLTAMDKVPVFSVEKVEYILAYDKALVRFVSGLAEQSLSVIETKKSLEERTEELQRAHDELEMKVKVRTAALAESNEMLLAEISERKRAEEKLRELSERDPLTMIYNRRKLFELLGIEVEKAKRYQRPLSLIMLDLDHFKQINDNYGHNIGDVVLKSTTGIIESVIRKVDIFARYGGEEFIILSPETDISGALVLAEKIRAAIEQHPFPAAGRVTISAGVAELADKDSGAGFIEKADSALYIAKKNGRNRVENSMETGGS